MAPDKFQQAWQSESTRPRLVVDVDLLDAVERSRQSFRTTIFWRDFQEVGIGLAMIPLWFYLGIRHSSPWTWYLTIPALLWVVGFILFDRRRHGRKSSEPGDPLISGVKDSLAQVEHQIWLLRNVFWWYLLPFLVSISAFFAHVFWSGWVQAPPEGWLETLIALGSFAFIFAVFFGVYAFVYSLNQYAVRAQLEPQRQELLTLLATLGEGAAGDVSGNYPILMGAGRAECSPRRAMIAGFCSVVIVAIGVPGILYLVTRFEESHDPRKSPFAAVRWEGFQPEVKVGDEWFRLVSLDGIAASDMVEYSRKTYGGLWRKRFEEDLVELLAGMGHRPGESVRLVVKPVGSEEMRTLEDVPMSAANRRAIWDAGRARERLEQARPGRGPAGVDD